MFYTYILHSAKLDKYYIGYSESLENRLAFHNSIERNKIWTKAGIPWRFVIAFQFTTRKDAMNLETRLKRSKSRKLIEALAESGILPESWGFCPGLVSVADPDQSG